MTTSRSIQSTTPDSSTCAASTRIIAIDLARFLAIVGMMAAHLLLIDPPAWVLAVDTGFPSTLFAVLGGLSSVLATRTLVHDGRRGAAIASLALRGATIAILGLLLIFVPTFVMPVLLPYGVALLLTSLLITAPTRMLVVVVAGLAVIVQPTAELLRTAIMSSTPDAYLFGDPLQFLASVFFTGPYPAATWLAYQLIGVLAGRLLTNGTTRPTSPSLALAGTTMTLAGIGAGPLLGPILTGPGAALSGNLWQGMLDATPHSGSLTDVLRTAGVSLLVIAALLLATARLPRPGWILLAPLMRAGSAPLTIYVAHILGTVPMALLLLSGSGLTSLPWWGVGPGALALNIAAALALGVLLSRLHRRGPLEAAVATVARLGARPWRSRA